MATVPTVTAPQVSPDATSAIPYNSGAGNSPDAFGANIGQAEEKVGGAISSVGDVLAKHAIVLQDRLNTANGADLYLKADEAAAPIISNFKTLQGKAAMDAMPTYLKDLEDVRQKFAAQAPNVDVEKAFTNDFKRRQGYWIQDGALVAGTQLKNFEQYTASAVTKLAQQQAATAKDNKDFTENQVPYVAQKATEEAITKYGSDGPAVDLYVRGQVSAAYKSRLENVASHDAVAAKQLFDSYKDKMSDQDQRAVEPTIDNNFIQQKGKAVADDIVQKGTGNVVDKMVKAEGQSKNPLSSATGTGQFIESTWLDQLQKTHPEIQGSREEKLAMRNDPVLGRELTQNYAMENGKALTAAGFPATPGNTYLAHFAGPDGAVKILNADPNASAAQVLGPAVAAANPFLRQMTAEGLQNWANRKMAGQSTIDLNVAYQRANTEAKAAFPDEPLKQQQLEDTITSKINSNMSLQAKATKDAESQRYNTVASELYSFNGQKPVTDFTQLSSAAQQAFIDSPPYKQEQFRRQFISNSKQDVPRTPETDQAKSNLLGMAIQQPYKFAAVDLTKENLTNADRSSLANLQFDANKRAKLNADTVKYLNAPEVKPQLTSAKVIDSATNSSQRENYQQFVGAFSTAKTQFEADKGGPITPKEAGELTSKLLRDQVLGKNMFGFDKTGPAYKAGSSSPISVKSAAEAGLLAPGTRYVNPNGDIFTR